MRTPLTAAFLIALSFVSLKAQQLTYTSRVERHPAVIKESVEAIAAGVALRELIFARAPEGATQMVTTVTPSSVRIAHEKGRVEIVAGTGHSRILNILDKTYWDAPQRITTSALPGFSSRLSMNRTGDTASIAGITAECLEFEVLLEPTQGDSLYRAYGQVWVVPRLAEYAKTLAELAPRNLILPTLAGLNEQGLIVRSTIESELLGPVKITTEITQIAEGPVVGENFNVPSAFKKVPPPESRQAELVRRVPANYPAEAARMKADGVVVLEVTVAKDGSVREPKILKSLGFGLDEEAVKSVLQWKYRPALLNGVPIDTRLTISFGFTYRERLLR